jgi:Serine dehydrogenase proteinase
VSTWGDQLKELGEIRKRSLPEGLSEFDILRRRYLKALADRTGRAVIVYATAYLEPRPTLDSPQALSVHLGDIQGFMEAVSNVQEREVDLFLHSPGGSAEAAESIVEYLRTRFDHIRVIVPVAAMSAATMIALSADEIVMGAHSQLGPIDPQFTISTPEGPRSAPAQTILDQFELAKRECADPKNIAGWLPILRSYSPGLIAQCTHQRELGESFVARWLERYMFKDDQDAVGKAKTAAAWFADFKEFKSHGRRVSREDARRLGLRILDLEADGELQDAMLSVYHAIHHTLTGTGAAKIIENHHGRAAIIMVQQMVLTQQQAPNPGLSRPGQPALPASATPPALNREQRRKQARQARKKS